MSRVYKVNLDFDEKERRRKGLLKKRVPEAVATYAVRLGDHTSFGDHFYTPDYFNHGATAKAFANYESDLQDNIVAIYKKVTRTVIGCRTSVWQFVESVRSY